MFAQHGNYSLYSDHSIIIFEAFGAWNVEASRNAIGKIKTIVDNMPTSAHGFIFDTHLVEGMTPDSYLVWSEAVNYWLSKGFNGLARIDDPESAHYKLFVEGFDIMLKEIIPFTFADDIAHALSWLHELEFKGFENGLEVVKQSSNNL
ncbi:hypothetical protein [Neptunicella sp. SCSIO 80796]|uniref:hypothetical protein n=1 Tax=Neptunicella plasticusilytica TaxID=3117012 RepID=UPI003A4DB7B4